MNSHIGGSWGQEERIPLPSGLGPVEAHIVVEKKGYKVLIGGTQVHFYCHRVPWKQFDRIVSDTSWTVGEGKNRILNNFILLELDFLQYTIDVNGINIIQMTVLLIIF
jgi:hypothetical protein